MDIDKNQELPTNPKRIKAFASFFKRYMSVSALITAALPIPVTSFQLIPTYEVMTKSLSVYTSLFCFLILAFIFYRRHYLARLFFPFDIGNILIYKLRRKIAFVGMLPGIFIFLSILCVLLYHFFLETNLPQEIADNSLNLYELRKDYLINNVPEGLWDRIIIFSLYLGIFVFAEAAFIIMAIKEYVQDLFNYTDKEVIKQKTQYHYNLVDFIFHHKKEKHDRKLPGSKNK